MAELVELDSIEIQAIIDNELDPISPCPNPAVVQSGGLRDIALRGFKPSEPSGSSPTCEIQMRNICCSAHGLSLLITGVKDGERRSLLFDTGPEGSAWERNTCRLQADVGRAEAIILSHWHIDHSGGMLKAIPMIYEHRKARKYDLPGVSVDLHPDRPAQRGVAPPEAPIVSLESDPTFEDLEQAGGLVRKEGKAHVVLGGMFMVSGEIPRVTSYEVGMRFGVRLLPAERRWIPDELLKDERLLMCKLKGKGIVVFTGCAHAGVVNSARHAIELAGGAPLYAVYGGFHLADADSERIDSTVRDLKALEPKLLLPGHCTGWRAKYALQSEMPGQVVPSFVGSSFTLSAEAGEDDGTGSVR